MIELQKIWNSLLEGRDLVERSEKSIDFWNKSLREKKAEVAECENRVAGLKKRIKTSETDLAELEEKYAKTEERLKQVTSERELDAQKHEHEKIAGEKDIKEESLMNLMDELDEGEKDLARLMSEQEESEKQVAKDIAGLEQKIDEGKSIIDEKRNEFDSLVLNISPEYRSRFQKLITSKNGRGIAEVEGEICSSCNFKIPASLAAESASDEKAVSCTNCGRFIYRVS